MIETTLVCRVHEQTILTHENAGQVHRLVNVVRRSIGLETVDADLRGRVQVPSRFGPQWLDVTGIAVCFATEEFVSARRCGRIKINSRFRRRCGNRKLIEMKRSEENTSELQS